MLTGIVILNYNNFNETINCLNSIFEFCPLQDLSIVVVDNYSKNDSVEQISLFLDQNKFSYRIIRDSQETKLGLEKIAIIKAEENLGYSGGNNLGIRFLIDKKVDNILILNNDVIFIQDIITPLAEILKDRPEIGLISPLLMKDEDNIDYNCCRYNPSMISLIFESLQYLKLPGTKKVVNKRYVLIEQPQLLNNELIYCDILSGACIMAKTSTWQEINYFDENTFLYYEENILYEKLKRRNLKSALLTNLTAIHLGAKSVSKIINVKILMIALDSLLYYVKIYRDASKFEIIAIKTIRMLQIKLLSINNWLKN